MDGKRLLHSLSLKGFLSYSRGGVQIGLEPLNVLVGPNASGKSNLLQAIELLRAAPVNLASPMYEHGGVREFINKGADRSLYATIAATVDVNDFWLNESILRHSFTFSSIDDRLHMIAETVADTPPQEASDVPKTYYDNGSGGPTLFTSQPVASIEGSVQTISMKWMGQKVQPQNFQSSASILSQRKDPDNYPEITALGSEYQSIKIYHDFNMNGPNSLRAAQRPDLPNDFLEEDGRNLSLILNDLHHRGVMATVVEKMRAVYEDVEDITVKVGGGVVQTFIRERGMSSPIPAARLSDGTLRYLCLLAILCHPEPPPLVCFEEPEVGMHPDLIATIADMLLEASQRMQIIVTTHSDILVSALSNVPEAVIVCERTEDGSQLRRLERGPLEKWLQDYSLGELWRTGEIGGVRY